MTPIDEEIIGKYLDGSCSTEENAAIESWLSEDSDNRLLFEKLRSIWQKSQNLDLDENISFDKSAAWNSIHPKLKKRSKSRTLKYWIPAVAASILLAVVLVLVTMHSDDKPQMRTVSATEDNYQYTLPDGSQVYMKAGASIRFDDDFVNLRNLSLAGTAYFDVSTDSSSAFTIFGPDFNVVVLGTEFYVCTEGEEIGVGVSSGSVAVVDKAGKRSEKLTKNQSIVYSKDRHTFDPVESLNPNKIYWQSGVLEFDKTPLHEVLNTLESVFEVDIQFSGQSITGCLFSGRFANADLQDILDQLSISLNLTIERSDVIKIVDSQCH